MTGERAYQRPETIPVWAEVRTWAGVLTDPSQGVKVTITTPSGVVEVDNTAMTKSETGKYVYYYYSQTDDPIGFWKCKTIAIDGSGETAKSTVTLGGFQLQ